MTRLRLSGSIVLAVVLVAVAIFYSFYQPFIPNAVYDAVPVQATFKHKVKSLDELLESPVCAQLDKALGAGNSLKVLLDSNDWVKLTASSEIAVATLPLRHADQPKSWVAISWVGWRSPWLRWKLEQTRTEGFSFLGKHSVWPVWKYETADIARGMSLTLSLTDNLFITCLSENPADIFYLLDTYDKRILSVNAMEQRKLK
ncbi:MAG: hypothetical protein ABFR47_07360 [Verrucomicrobiota bacterium]